MTDQKKAAAGRKGGRAGTNGAKRRPRSQYVKMGKLSAAKRSTKFYAPAHIFVFRTLRHPVGRTQRPAPIRHGDTHEHT
jgi:hypothetical protein